MPAKSISTFFSVLFKTDSDCGLSSGRTGQMYKKTSFTIDFHGLAKDVLSTTVSWQKGYIPVVLWQCDLLSKADTHVGTYNHGRDSAI